MENRSSITNTAAADPLGRTKEEIVLEVCLAVIICFVSIAGNLLVVVVMNRDPRLRNITNSFIHNLAWTDICTATLNMPFWIISLYHGRWIFSELLCNCAAAVLSTSAVASVMTMGLVAVNRYLKVVKPAIYPIFFPRKQRARIYCACVWLVTVLLATPPFYGWGKFAYHEGFCVCTLLYEWHISYSISIAGVAVNGVTCVIVFCYYKIYGAVTTSSANVNAHATQASTPNASNSAEATDIKILKATFTVVCVYLLCWIPVTMVALSEAIFAPAPRFVNIFVIFLMYCSSGVNPIIYSVMNPKFKAAFVKVLKCKVTRKDSQENPRVSGKGTQSSQLNQDPKAAQPKAQGNNYSDYAASIGLMGECVAK